MGHIGRQAAHQPDGVVPALYAQVDVLAEHGELTRQVTVHFGQVLEARRVGNGAFLPAHERVGAAARHGNADGVRRLDQRIAHFAHLGQEAHGVLVHRGIQFDHGPRDFRFDAVGDGVVGHLGQQLVGSCRQVVAGRVDQLQLELDAQGVRGRRNERNLFHLGLLRMFDEGMRRSALKPGNFGGARRRLMDA